MHINVIQSLYNNCHCMMNGSSETPSDLVELFLLRDLTVDFEIY